MIGVWLSNRQWSLYPQAELDAAIELRPQLLAILGYGQSAVLPEKVAQEAWLWEKLGRPPVVLRPYAPFIMQRTPQDWSFECYMLVQKYKAAGMDPSLLCANELNLRGERDGGDGLIEDWGVQARWLRDFAVDFRMRSPDTMLHIPALSPQGNYMVGLLEYAEAHLGEAYQRVDVHCYGSYDLSTVGVAAGLFDLPVFVSEINRVAPSVYAPILRDYGAWGSAWFILRWETPDPQQPNVDLIGSQYYDDFRSMTQGGNTMPEFQVGPGILAAMAAHNEDPVEDEHYLGDRESYCATSEAIYVYSKGANRVARLPFE